jgi:hypothetical protein
VVAGLKSCQPDRCRDRCATGPGPALDPGTNTAPDPAAARARKGARPRQARGARHCATKIKSLQPSLYGFRGLPWSRPRLAGCRSVERTALLPNHTVWACNGFRYVARATNRPLSTIQNLGGDVPMANAPTGEATAGLPRPASLFLSACAGGWDTHFMGYCDEGCR